MADGVVIFDMIQSHRLTGSPDADLRRPQDLIASLTYQLDPTEWFKQNAYRVSLYADEQMCYTWNDVYCAFFFSDAKGCGTKTKGSGVVYTCNRS